jgi:hypothetical protein
MDFSWAVWLGGEEVFKGPGFTGFRKLFQSPEGTVESSPGRQSRTSVLGKPDPKDPVPLGTAEDGSTGFHLALQP